MWEIEIGRKEPILIRVQVDRSTHSFNPAHKKLLKIFLNKVFSLFFSIFFSFFFFSYRTLLCWTGTSVMPLESLVYYEQHQ